MAGAVAQTRVKEKPAFLLVGDSASEPILAAVPKKLFARSTERLRVSLYSLLFLTDIALIGGAFLGAGAIRLGSPFEAQSLRTAAVVIVTFVAIAAHNRAYSIRALQRPAYGAAKVAEALGYAIAVAIALLFFTKASEQFSRAIFAEGTALALLSTVLSRLLAGAHLRRKYSGNFVNRLVILDGVDFPAWESAV